MEYIVKILNTEYISQDMKRFTVEKPKGYKFEPGQATELSINTPELKNEKRPFTFTSLNNWDTLEFIIKIYEEHNGISKQLGRLKDGDELIVRDVWGAITYKGKGVFIAGGAGITPFIAILRQLARDNQLEGHSLIYSNKTSKDVVLKEEFEKMLHGNFFTVFTRERIIGFLDKRIDEDYLKSTIRNFNQKFYLCGPEKFVKDLEAMFLNLGAQPESIIIEK